MIAYIANDTTDHTVTFSFSGVRWEYWLTPSQCRTVDYLTRRVSSAKALTYAKSRATRSERLTHAPQ